MKTDQEILEQLKGSGGNESRRNLGLVAFVILLAIVIGVFTAVNNRTDKSKDQDNNVVAEETTDQNSGDQASTDNAAATGDTKNDTDKAVTSKDTTTSVDLTRPTKESFVITPTTGSSHTDSEYTETAQVGEGVTHLARRAANTYLSDKGIKDISREQRVYVEDYLSKLNNPVLLGVSNTRTFKSSQIEQAISLARALTPAELTNLRQYSAQVTVY